MKLNFAVAGAFTVLALMPVTLRAHCDGLDGPVVQAGRRALETRDVKPALAWVRAADEGEVKGAFDKTLAVRQLSPEGKELADRYFFETLVRVHRAGENAPYTGLKPAGRDLGPAIPGADKAIADGSMEPLLQLLSGGLESGLRERFERVLKARKTMNDGVEAGRAYVAAYVEFIHYVEGVHEASAAAGEHRQEEH
jgi:hypothetical protein